MTEPFVVDIAAFPIAVAQPQPRGDDGDHTLRAEAICGAVGAALALPASVRVDSHTQYATLNYCSGGGPDASEYRIRINGFAFGKGSKKNIEYLSVSILGLHGGQIVAWSEDVQKLGGSAADWAAFHAGKLPGGMSPPNKKGSPKDVALLTFVDAAGKPLPISAELRALVK